VLFVLGGEFRLFVITETTFAFLKFPAGLKAGMFYFHLNNFGLLNKEAFLKHWEFWQGKNLLQNRNISLPVRLRLVKLEHICHISL